MRLVMRRMLNKLLADGELTPSQAEYVRQIKWRPRLFGTLVDRVHEKADEEGFETQAIGDGELLKWLWENREAILAFIKQIVELFS